MAAVSNASCGSVFNNIGDPQAKSSVSDYVCDLNITSPADNVRSTKIICTIGPTCDSPETLQNMILAGMNVARLDLTLGSFQYNADVMKRIREQEKLLQIESSVAFALDITGPTVRTGLVCKHGDQILEEGHHVTLTNDEAFKDQATVEKIWVDTQFFPNIFKALSVNDKIYLDEGNMHMIVREVYSDCVRCMVVQGGQLTSSVRVHIPHKNVYMYAIRDRLLESIKFANQHEVDFLYISFVESGEDMLKIRKLLTEMGAEMQMVARIETKAAAMNIEGILDYADGIVVCRGDLALEIPPEKVFIAQKLIIARCQRRRVPVMVATQMMESMRQKPRPTRAEVSDVANAVMDGADGLVLTVETAIGSYPLEVVKFMHKVCREAEGGIFNKSIFNELVHLMPIDDMTDPTMTAALAAVEASLRSNAKAIIVTSTLRNSAQLISSFRPRCPIMPITRSTKEARHCQLHRGIYPVLYSDAVLDNWADDMDNRIKYAIELGRSYEYFQTGDPLVIVHEWSSMVNSTNTVRIFEVPAKGSDLMVLRPTTFTG